MAKILESEIELMIAIPSVIIGLLGIGIAYIMYRKESAIPDRLVSIFKFSYKWAYNKFYMDELWLFVYKKDNLQIYIGPGRMVRSPCC